jgi:hypothetical protein
MKDFERAFRDVGPVAENKSNSDDFDEESINDIDFSEIAGHNFKKSFSNVHKKIKQVRVRKKKPLSKTIPVTKNTFIDGNKKRKLGRVIVPNDRKVIVESVGKFILSDKFRSVKNIGYHNGSRLKEIVFIFNNNSALDFNLELFNPSEPLDYLYSTSQTLNNKIQVSGGMVSYTDVLFNCLANPPFIYNSKIVITGPLQTQQVAQPLIFINKNSAGKQQVDPVQLLLHIDNMQVEGRHIQFFDVAKNLQRPFIPDGMDVIQYKVLAGNTVTMAFYCKQPLLKNRLYKESKENKKII